MGGNFATLPPRGAGVGSRRTGYPVNASSPNGLLEGVAGQQTAAREISTRFKPIRCRADRRRTSADRNSLRRGCLTRIRPLETSPEQSPPSPINYKIGNERLIKVTET